jgi:hypothetical protein
VDDDGKLTHNLPVVCEYTLERLRVGERERERERERGLKDCVWVQAAAGTWAEEETEETHGSVSYHLCSSTSVVSPQCSSCCSVTFAFFESLYSLDS